MNTELLGVGITFLLSILIALPLARYIRNVYSDKKSWMDRVLGPFEKVLMRLSNIDPTRPMSWQQNLFALLTINFVWFLVAMLTLMNMGWLPLNPDGNPSMSADLAFNTSVSFISNTNLQHYSGETGMSYLGLLVLMFFHFVSAGTGMGICAVVIKAMTEGDGSRTANFYSLFIRSCTRILLPLSVVVAVILAMNGMPMTFDAKAQLTTLQGDSIQVSHGPVAAYVAIKHLGTNGGGFFGANSAHPFENPSYLTNIVEMIAQMVLPMAMVFALGYMLNRKRLSYMLIGVMTIGFLALVIPTIVNEVGENPLLVKQGISQSLGNMEGKEMRFGSASSAYWSIATTVTSTGSVNSMHDSFNPLSGMNQMLGMMVNCFYGGAGVGLLNMYVFIILAVFISGLMVGRTPEFLGKKIEAREMKIAMLIALLHPFLILAGTALSSHIYTQDPSSHAAWLNNPGFHGFSEMLYEFSSSAANNGSGFEGLGDNVPFWNIACGLVMLLSRYIPIIGPVAIAGILSTKQYIPEGSGTLKTDTLVFGMVLMAVILIIAALSFFPALALGPLAEYFSMH